MRAEAHQGVALAVLTSSRKPRSSSREVDEKKLERTKIGKDYPCSSARAAEMPASSAFIPIRSCWRIIRRTILSGFYRQDAEKCPFRLNGRHRSESVIWGGYSTKSYP